MSSSARYLATCLLLCTGLLPAAATARTWTVRADSTGDAPTIQAALDSAVNGDDVLVMPGTYNWTNQGMGSSGYGPSMLDVGYRVRLHSESGASRTVLDAQGQGRVAICRFCDGIDGFTIINGLTLRDTGGGYGGMGGGIFSFGGRPRFENNILRSNYAGAFGGGIAIHAGRFGGAAAVIRFNSVLWNTAALRTGGIDLGGGDSTVVENNTVAGNWGGGIACVDCFGRVTRNIISENGRTPSGTAGGFGLLCLLFTGDSLAVDCNIFWNNPYGNESCGTSGGGNLVVDPRFCVSDPGGTGARFLRPGSPALPENSACGLLVGATGVGCSVTAANDLDPDPVTLTIAPNPPASSATFRYSTGRSREPVHITVYDLAGRIVRRLRGGSSPAGNTVFWDGHNEAGSPVPAGMYLVRLDTGTMRVTKKLVLIR